MDRINRILRHPIFEECLKRNEMAEADRCFCHHDMEHLCAVARIAMLLNLEENSGLSKDMVYAAAFLHDCGRYKQYESGIPHEEAGAEIACRILRECGYTPEETEDIAGAVASHRGSVSEESESTLADILYRADKLSRNCRFCKAYEVCNWPDEIKYRPFYLLWE